MVDRYRVWLGAGVLAGGVSAAMLAGAGTAVADDGSSSESRAGASSGSADSDSSPSGPKAKSGSEDTDAEDTDAEDAEDAEDTEAEDADAEDAEDTEDQGETEETGDPEETDPEEVEPDPSPVGKHRDPEPEETTQADPGAGVPADVPVTAEQAGEVPQSDVTSPVDQPDSTLVTTVETDLSSGDGAVVMRAAAVTAPNLNTTPPEVLEFLNGVGTFAYNLFTSAMQFLAGPARAPFGSSVRVERSTLTIGNGVVVPADWYFPDNDTPPAGVIYFQHGFLATASFYSATAAYLAEKTNSIVVAPTLTWNIFDTDDYPLMLPHTHRAIAELFGGDRAALNASAQAAGYAGTLPTRLVLTGHSAGGGLVAGTAGYMAELGIAGDLAGVVMLDGVGHLDHLSTDLAKIPLSIPVYNLAGEPYGWNTFGDANIRLAQARPGVFTGVVVEGGRHSDSMQSANPVLQFAAYLATGFSSPWNITANEVLAGGWINDMLTGGHTAKLYGPAGSTLNILTGWRLMPARVLPVENVKLDFIDNLYACLLNPTTLNCTYVPFWGAATKAHRTSEPGSRTVAV